ncbi:hypothetical protein AYO38_05910 [bacterium SCGC AG-212-C10]|nr:hypothetical protein AYO38_05910 [bacterium SCGC AG-212-C10]
MPFAQINVGRAKPLRVLQVGTVNKPIGPRNGYSPIETVILNIDQGLHNLGHRSIVACSADSTVAGEHFPTIARSLGDYCRDSSPEGDAQIDRHLEMALERARAGDIDVIHMHQWFERVYSGRFNPPVPIVMTLHVPGADSGVAEFASRLPGRISWTHPRIHNVAISDYQRRQYADLIPVGATIPHGVDVSDFLPPANGLPQSYLFSIGRITEVKGQDTAIEVARRSGKRLILAGCVQNKPEDSAFFDQLKSSIQLSVDLTAEPVGPDYFERVMRPILSTRHQIIYVGELTAAATKHWYHYAEATLFPIRWGEPFGMVLIESMAAGTPVIAFAEGAVPEIIRDGETGFIVDSVDSMVRAVGRLAELDRQASRRHVATTYSTLGMAEQYAALYQRLVEPMESAATRAQLADILTIAPPPVITRQRVAL